MGNTGIHGRQLFPSPVHPHVRGEHFAFSGSSVHHTGSSPRAWGTLPRDLLPVDRPRFIPTCVGNTRSLTWSKSSVTVHPHVRGEHDTLIGGESLCAGSSPRAWGTLKVRMAWLEKTRFIPTCVGNTSQTLGTVLCRPVHPHVRGEHFGRK